MVNELPPDQPDEDQPSAREGVFSGVRIVDFSSGIAGPYATMFLADHGADVIKVESPGGDPFRASPGFETLNRGKRSVRLDHTSDSGRNRTRLLGRLADVVVVDLPQGRAEERGIGYDQLAAANPGLVYLAVPPYGDAGPMVDRPSSPALLAAVSGIMAGQASYSGNPSYVVLPIACYGAGALGAAAVAGGLYARERWGVGQRLDVPQIAGAAALQVGGVTSDQVAIPEPGPAPAGSKGVVPIYRLFKASDGLWFFVACGTAAFAGRLLIAIGRPELAADPRLEHAPWGLGTEEARALLVPLLEEVFGSQSRDHWIGVLREYDVPAQPVLSRDEYFDSYTVSANEMRVSVEHPDYEWVEMMGVPLRLTATPGQVHGRAPRLGEHTDDVLAEVAAAPPPVARIASRDPGPHLLEGVRVLDATSVHRRSDDAAPPGDARRRRRQDRGADRRSVPAERPRVPRLEPGQARDRARPAGGGRAGGVAPTRRGSRRRRRELPAGGGAAPGDRRAAAASAERAADHGHGAGLGARRDDERAGGVGSAGAGSLRRDAPPGLRRGTGVPHRWR